MKKVHIVAFVLISSFFFSCKKSVDAGNVIEDARYTITITSKWSSPDFTVPPGAHFTTFAGMIHNTNTFLWKENTLASFGVETLAETGGGGPILYEIDSIIATKNAASLIYFVAPPVTGSASVNILCTTAYSCVSFASMIGPTPDWFIGVSGLNLYANNRWVSDTTFNLLAYDCGTEDGDMFGYANPATVPQQKIHILTPGEATVLANGSNPLKPIATVRLQRK